ncbi:pecanex 2, partial [Pelobates cultripes]
MVTGFLRRTSDHVTFRAASNHFRVLTGRHPSPHCSIGDGQEPPVQQECSKKNFLNLFIKLLPPTMLVLILNCSSIAVLFAAIKLTNYWLHLMFDKGMIIHHKGDKMKSNTKDDQEISNVNISINHTSVCVNTEDANKMPNKQDLSVSNYSSSKWKEINGISSSDSLVLQMMNSFEDPKVNYSENYTEEVVSKKNICETPPYKLEQNKDYESNNSNSYHEKLSPQNMELNIESVVCLESEGQFIMDSCSLQQPESLNTASSQSDTPKILNQGKQCSSHAEASSFSKKLFYKCIFPEKWMEIWHDRLTLLSLLDRTEDFEENILIVFLAIMVSFLGFWVLNHGLFKDIWILQFCVVIASCQFSLLK